MNLPRTLLPVVLATLAAWPALAPAVDVGELIAIYTRQAEVKGFTPPQRPADFAADFAPFAASGEFKAAIDAPKSAGDPHLGPRLKRLIAAQQVKGGGDWSRELDTLDAPVAADTVGLTLLPESAADSAVLLKKVQNLGGEGLIASATGTVLATVPGDRLEALLDATPTGYLDLQPRYEPFFGPTTGEGVAMMRIPALHDAGVKGQGVTVAVLDLGFKSYSQLVNSGELPKARATQAFGRYPFGERSVHGTACAEIVADVAPAAEQALVQFDGGQQSVQQALQWLRTQKIDIVNASWGDHLRRIDGLDATDQEIDRFVRDTGVVWVNAAGNEAEQTWTGPVADRNGDGWVDVTVGNESRNFLIVQAQGPYSIHIQWDDWGSSVQPTATQDLDAYLFVKQGGQWTLWDRSEVVQNGRQYPEEVLKGASLPGGVAALLIKRKRVTRNDLHVRVAVPRGVQVTPHSPPYSLSSPASARQALAVGAVDIRTKALANYSSNGPSWDRRLKPEVSAPTGVISQAYTLEGGGDGRFHGTSAAAPHVVGFAALLASTGEKPRGPALRAAIERSIQPMGQPQPNNGYGRGLTVARPASARPAETPPNAEPPPVEKPPADQPPSDVTGRVKRKLDELLQKP